MTEYLKERQKLNEEAWGKGYHLFPQVLKSRGAKVGVEVGIAFGGHSEAILKRTDVCRLYGVDSYQHFDDYSDGMNLPQPAFDLLYEQTRRRLNKFGDRFELIRAKSLDAVKLISEPLDFVYIDADHSCRGCLQDIMGWFPKVKEGGIIGGHDYDSSIHPGVTVAVGQFFGHLGWKINLEGYGCWWVEKQRLGTICKLQLFLAQFWWKCCLSITGTLKRLRLLLRRDKGFVLSLISRFT